MKKQNIQKIAGVVAGVGPYAGLDMQRKIFEQTVATTDQEHLTVIGWYQSSAIPDRTSYLLGKSDENPAYPIAEQLLSLEKAGASVAAIPCNTAHAPAIFDTAIAELKRQNSPLQVLHMIGEVALHLSTLQSDIQRVGVLSTIGTYDTQIYPAHLEPLGYQVVVPPRDWQLAYVDTAIYDPDYGIKAVGTGTEQARSNLLQTIALLRDAGAQAIILGCTELPLAFTERAIDGLPLIDPTLILARAVVREVDCKRLRVLSSD